jgi:hypothetical protein
MKQVVPNDTRYIAEQFFLAYDHTNRTAQLAYHKINSYKLSLSNESYCMSRKDLYCLVKNTLFNEITGLAVCSKEDYTLIDCLN